jgi:hypothetical protein
MKRPGKYLRGLAILFLSCCLTAGHPARAKDEWLPISPADLALQDNPKSLGGDAMILYRENSIQGDEFSITDYVRIKVLTQPGSRYGTVSIPFVKGQSEIKDLRARTVHANGESIDFDGQTFDKVLSKVRGQEILAKTFLLSSVAPGSIVEYKYRQQFDRTHYVGLGWTIQEDLYTREAHFSIKPASFGGAFNFSFQVIGLPPEDYPQRQKDGTYTLDVHDVPGLDRESYMLPDSFVRSRVDFYYRSRFDPPNESVEQYWKRIGKLWADSLDEYINKKGVLSAEVARITKPEDSPETKLREINGRVQKIRDLSLERPKSDKEQKQESLKPNENVEDVLKHGYGTDRQINYLFVGLARAAGFEAKEVYVAPRSYVFFSPALKDSRGLISDIVWVRAGSKEYYLDPAARFFPFGVLPWTETSVDALRVSADGGEIVTTPAPSSKDSTLVRNADLRLDENGNITGTISAELTGQAGALQRESLREADEIGRHKALEDEVRSWLPAGSTFDLTKISSLEEIEQPLRVEGNVSLSGASIVSGNRILVPVTLFPSQTAQSFQSNKRVNAVYFTYPYEHYDHLRFQAPTGYRVEVLPAVAHRSPGAVSYDISSTSDGDIVEVKRQLIVSSMVFPVQYYAALRFFFSTVRADDEAKFTFKAQDTSK